MWGMPVESFLKEREEEGTGGVRSRALTSRSTKRIRLGTHGGVRNTIPNTLFSSAAERDMISAPVFVCLYSTALALYSEMKLSSTTSNPRDRAVSGSQAGGRRKRGVCVRQGENDCRKERVELLDLFDLILTSLELIFIRL